MAMTQKNDGGPAFPELQSSLMREHMREPHRFTHDYKTTGGMSLRDWFAGQSLAGIAMRQNFRGIERSAAEQAYAIADAMLAERSKE